MTRTLGPPPVLFFARLRRLDLLVLFATVRVYRIALRCCMKEAWARPHAPRWRPRYATGSHGRCDAQTVCINQIVTGNPAICVPCRMVEFYRTDGTFESGVSFHPERQARVASTSIR